MAAATQTARTSPPNPKMTSPKDNKGAIPVVTKTEGECPNPQCACSPTVASPLLLHINRVLLLLLLLSFSSFARASRHLIKYYCYDERPLTMSSPEPAEVKTDTKEIRKCRSARRD